MKLQASMWRLYNNNCTTVKYDGTKRFKGTSMNAFYRAGFSLCLLCITVSAVCQQPAASGATEKSQPVTAVPSDNSDRSLTLDVVVTDKSGKPVSGLQQQDFTVLDNKRPTRIVSFHSQSGAALPTDPNAGTELFLIFDEVNTTFDKVWYGRDGVKKFLTQNHGELSHPVSLAFFSDSGMQIQTEPSLDGNGLAAALDQHQNSLRTIGRGAEYGDEDRLRLSLDALNTFVDQEKTRPGRKMVIWISPGWPLLSGPGRNLSSGQQQRVFDSVVRLSGAMRQARITMYSIDPLGAAGAGGTRTAYYENFTKGLVNPSHAELGDLGLQVLAAQNGGRVIFGNDSIVNSIDHCVADLNAFYVLSITPAPADRTNEYHGLEVKLGTPGLTARTQTGYYTKP